MCITTIMDTGVENRSCFQSTFVHNSINHKSDDVSCANLKTLAYVASMVQAEEHQQRFFEDNKNNDNSNNQNQNKNKNNNQNTDSNNDRMYWLRDDWVPVHDGTGERKSAPRIREELIEYMQTHQLNKAQMLKKLGVHVNSFNNFMKPYKQPWRGFGNATYWAAARLLEEERHKNFVVASKTIITPAFTDRRLHDNNTRLIGNNVVTSMTTMNQNDVFNQNHHSTENNDVQMNDAPTAMRDEYDKEKENSDPKGTFSAKWYQQRHKIDAAEWMEQISSFQTSIVSEYRVYDSCAEIIGKIHDFLALPGVTKAQFCRALGCVNSNSLQTFLRGNEKHQRGNCTYRRAWVFFEKKRILEGAPKTATRLRNEQMYPNGFPLKIYGSKPMSEHNK